MHYQIKFLEAFKDGNLLDGRFVKQMEVVVVSERELAMIRQSGAYIEVIQQMIPNVKKIAEELASIAEKPEEVDLKQAVVELKKEVDKPVKRGRPKKSA